MLETYIQELQAGLFACSLAHDVIERVHLLSQELDHVLPIATRWLRGDIPATEWPQLWLQEARAVA